MQSTSITSWHTGYYYPVPKHHLFSTHKSKSQKTHCKNHSFITLLATHSCSKEQEKNQNQYPKNDNNSYPDQQSHKFFQDFYSSIESPKTQFVQTEEESESEIDTHLDISSNMWWTDLKAALGQRINLEGITSSVGILSKDKHLVIPHVTVPDIRSIDWAELKNRGFKGVVFDKDNTITAPYSLSLWPPLGSSIEQCKFLFGNNIAVFSNSAGLFEYDPDGRKARALEDAIGIKVIQHKVKKPAGTAEEIEKHFGCESSRLIMVGDRPFTDIVYGNRNGFFTILTEPLSAEEEPLIVKQVRHLKLFCSLS
ncbi:hypothetical protein RD792_007158 [Penstemon davidsonii]|uniref:Uncharacterized protein n=1 Tax=Penstemon davidsonii TaxID=160366 RepID=A0ABR0D6C4_9LAMI|nr:hypothetical protein RD792_007158 [Penstemon davidsonii]